MPQNVASVLGEARQAYVGIVSKEGPHVTPELYAWSNGQLWFAAATSTLKARIIETGTTVALAVVGRGSSVVLEGAAEVLDLRRPRSLARRRTVPRAMRALLSFSARNSVDLAGFARDAVSQLQERGLPNMRVLVAVTPDRAALVENDVLTWHHGWEHPDHPDASTEIPAGGEAAVVGFEGPRVLPARWFAEDGRVFVPPQLLALAGVAGEQPIAVVVDRYNAPGPEAKEGVLLRGDGVIADDGWIDVTSHRTLRWDGTDVATVKEAGQD